MNEEIRGRIAALNVAWQRYVRTAEEQPDPAVTEALKRDYYAAWEGLDACGIAEWMLEYNPATLTFSLPTTAKMADDGTAMTFAMLTRLTARNRRDDDDPDTEQIPVIE
jgi:hypothetical protein